MADTPDILKKILDHKLGEVSSSKIAIPPAELRASVADLPPPRGFRAALQRTSDAKGTAIIAEVKKGSPSKGVIRADFDPLSIAAIYAENGAACLSILTDEHFFLGRLEYLKKIRNIVNLPLLRKDFIFDPYQVYEARSAGADAILLIASMLDLPLLRDLVSLAGDLALDVLLEVHDEGELEKALEIECAMIGINNRNLRTFDTNLSTTERLAARIPSDRLIVAESGINSRADLLRLADAGAKAFLIGESLMREADIGAKLRQLLGRG
jgi:indole-3-glycerol phosphate synthase